jgi:diamine N-acetyltransferase
MTTPTLVGQRVVLKPVTKAIIPYLAKWYSNPEILRLIGGTERYTREKAEQGYHEESKDTTSIWFTIMVKPDDRVIGKVGLLRMFRPWQTTDMSVVIGEKAMWGHGYGTDAGKRLLQYAFDELRFHRVAIGVVGFNTRAVRFWTGLGFQQEGIARESYYCDNQYSDFIMMSILEDEYRHKYDSSSS